MVTRREKPVDINDDFMYRLDRRSADGGKFWRCLNDGCNGRIKTDDNDVFVAYRNRTHIHPSNAEEAQVRGVVTSIKERAKAESTNMMAIYSSETAGLSNPPSVAAIMPTFQEVRNKILS
jgi:FLYWCH zinc finger domain